MNDDLAEPAAAVRSARAPLRLILLAWTAAYLALMARSGWAWEGQGLWTFGAPDAAALERFGAPVPRSLLAGAWQRALLSPFLARTLVGFLFLLWMQVSIGRQLADRLGAARAWTIFLLSGAGGALVHALAHADSGSVGGAGPFAAVLGELGALLCWGLRERGRDASRVFRATLASLLVIGLLAWGLNRDVPWTAGVREQSGFEALLGGLGIGIAAMAALGPRRARAPAGRPTKAVALALALAVVVAAGVQAFAGGRGAGPTLRFLEQLEQTEYEAWAIAREPARADAAQRAALSERLDAIAGHAWVDGHPGAALLRAYVETLRAYASPDVPRPWETESRCRRAFRAWYEAHERPSRESLGLPARTPSRFFWESP